MPAATVSTSEVFILQRVSYESQKCINQQADPPLFSIIVLVALLGGKLKVGWL
jgi:hypothetical protein